MITWRALVLTLGAASALQTSPDLERDKAAIVQTVLDYAEGYYGGEPQRMARAVAPSLSKRALVRRPGASSYLLQMNAETLIEAANGAKLPRDQRHITVDVLDVTGDVASARALTAQFNDYLQLVRRNGAWQIANVLWHNPPPAAAPAGVSADVEAAVKDYAAALFAADGPRALAVLHPLAHLRTFAQPPQGRPRVVRDQNPDTLAAALAAGQMKPAGTIQDAQVIVHGVDSDIAAARLSIGSTTTYLHLALVDGTWRIVNTLAYAAPAPRP